MRVLFSDFAKQELEDAVNYLELEFEGLGESLKNEVKGWPPNELHFTLGVVD